MHDLNGNKITELNNETIEMYKDLYDTYPYFTNGYMQRVVFNDSGSKFYTVTDRNGNFMYDPNKLEFESRISSGLILVKSKDFEGYINVNGDVVIGEDGDFSGLSPFSDGIAIVYSKTVGAYVYIDTEGNILFLDKIVY